MLPMDDIKYIRRMFKEEGCSIREIMRRTGYHYETTRKYIDMEDFNKPPRPPRVVPSLLDPLKPIIDKWLEEDLKAPRKQRHTGKLVYKRLTKEYPTQLDVKMRTVQTYVSQKKRELFSGKGKCYLPLEHPAGEVQVDFCQFSYYDNAGIMKVGRKLTVSFPFSNGAYCQIFHGENQECLLQGLKTIMFHMGKAPSRMVFDNLSTAVIHIGSGKERTLTEGFKRFAEHYGFESVFCNPASGWEKGNVESKVGYERRNMFVPVPHITDFGQFNKELLEICELDMQREHYRKEKSIAELFETDRQAMLPVNTVDFKVARLQVSKANKYGKIVLDTNLYSTSPKFAQEQVYLEIGSDTVTILDLEYNFVVKHPRLYEKNGESMNWLPYLSLLAKRPYALKYTGFYNELPEIWQNHLSEMSPEKKKDALLTLRSMLEKTDMYTATEALRAALRGGVEDSDSILASYHRITEKKQPMQPMQFSNPCMIMPSFKIDNMRYDDLFHKGVD